MTSGTPPQPQPTPQPAPPSAPGTPAPRPSPAAAGAEPDWPWLFSPTFWMIAMGGALLVLAVIGARSWIVLSTRAAPLEFFALTPARAWAGESIPVRVLVRDATQGSRLEGATVRLCIRRFGFPRELASGTTGDDGLALLHPSLPRGLSPGRHALVLEAAAKPGKFRARHDLHIVLPGSPSRPGAIPSPGPIAAGQTPVPALSGDPDPLRLVLLPESGQLVPGVPNGVYVLTARQGPDASPAPAVIFTGGGTRVQTNELGIGQFSVRPDKSPFHLTLSVRAAAGEEFVTRRQLPVEDASGGILLRPDQAVYGPGQIAQITLLSSTRARYAFVDVEQEGRTLASQPVDLEGGQAQVSLSLPPDLTGWARLQVHAFLPQGGIVRDSRRIFLASPPSPAPESGPAFSGAPDSRPAAQTLAQFLHSTAPGPALVSALRDASTPTPPDPVLAAALTAFSPSHRDPALEELQAACLAVASEATPPASFVWDGTSRAERKARIEAARSAHVSSLLRLLAFAPFTILLLLAMPFLHYGVLRLHFAPSWDGGLQRGLFEEALRSLYLRFTAAILSLPLAFLILEVPGLPGREVLLPGVFLALSLGFAVALTVKARELRGLGYSLKRLPLFRRLVVLIPLLFILATLALAGAWSAAALRPDSFPPPSRAALGLALLLLLSAASGCLGHLRGALTQPRPWRRNALSFLLHSLPPGTAFLLWFLLQRLPGLS